jgi:hypothetical protein
MFLSIYIGDLCPWALLYTIHSVFDQSVYVNSSRTERKGSSPMLVFVCHSLTCWMNSSPDESLPMIISPNFKSLCSLPLGLLIPSVVENVKWRRFTRANGECTPNKPFWKFWPTVHIYDLISLTMITTQTTHESSECGRFICCPIFLVTDRRNVLNFLFKFSAVMFSISVFSPVFTR